MNKTLPPKPLKAKVEMIRVSDLAVDHDYQRRLNHAEVRRIVEKFDPSGLGLLTVSRRDGANYLIDGQQRQAALMEVGWADRPVKCEVFTDLIPEQEAALFVLRNNFVTVGMFDKFIARVAAGELAAVDIQRSIDRHNLVLDPAPKDGTIKCVAALEAIYNGENVRNKDEAPFRQEVDWTLDTVIAAWGPTPAALHGVVVKGVGMLYLRHGKIIDRARLVQKLATVPAGGAGVLGKAKGIREFRGGSLAACVAEFCTTTYNKGLRANKLPEWRA